MRIEFAPAAARHRVSRDRIRYVIDHCRNPLYPPPDDRDGADVVLILGPDERGVPLEIVAIETEDDGLCVIHAMRLRSKYADEYRKVMRQR